MEFLTLRASAPVELPYLETMADHLEAAALSKPPGSHFPFLLSDRFSRRRRYRRRAPRTRRARRCRRRCRRGGCVSRPRRWSAMRRRRSALAAGGREGKSRDRPDPTEQNKDHVLEDLLGDGIFNVDGAKWRHQRKVASLEFSTRVLRDYSSAVFRDTAAELAGIVDAAARAGEKVDMQDLLMRSTLDSIFNVGFGVSLGSLSGSSEKGAAFAKAFDDASERVLYRFFDLFWKAKRILNVSSEAAMKRSVRVIDEFVYAVIDKKIEQMARDQHEFAKKEDILSRFLLERERDPGCFDNKYLRDIILNFVIAGRDTTSGTLSWFLYLLCRDERVQDRIAREVRAAATSDRDVGIHELAACLTEDAIGRMQYLHAALTETLRLYPGVPIDVKYCFSDDTLPDGYAVKKGDMVNYQPYPMGRMKFLWGEDAEEFRPERWLDDDGVFVPESPFKFTAFQAGPRICLGKEFAYRQMKIFAAVLLYLFKIEMWDRNATVGYRPMLTLKMDGPLYVRASLRR